MTDFATKDDVRAVKDDVRAVRNDLRDELKQVETSLRGEIGSLREDVHFLGVRFEQLDSKVTAIGEGLIGFREHFTEEIRKLREELSGRISLLEEVVRGSSADVRKGSADIQALQAEVASLRRRFDRYEQESALEERVTEIEKRLGIR